MVTRQTGRPDLPNYLLSGFLFCGKCGANMAGCAAKSWRFFYHTCHNKVHRGEHGCNAPLISRGKIERSIVQQLKLRVLTEENLTKLIRMINEDVSQGKSRVEEQLEAKGAPGGGLRVRAEVFPAHVHQADRLGHAQRRDYRVRASFGAHKQE